MEKCPSDTFIPLPPADLCSVSMPIIKVLKNTCGGLFLLTLFTSFLQGFFYLITLTISLILKHNFTHLYKLMLYWVLNSPAVIKS